MGELLVRGIEPHKCRPLMDRKTLVSNNIKFDYDEIPPMGTIWRCECGRLWEVKKYYPPARGVISVGDREWREAGLWTSFRVWWRCYQNVT